MSIDDLAKLARNSLLLSLDRIIGPRLIKVVYLLGLGAAILWSVSHFFATFGTSFGAGLWGLAEIAVFGLLGVISLRIVCEALIVYFKAHGHEAEPAQSTVPATLIDEVRDAIEDLAADDAEPEPAKSIAASPKTARAHTPAKTAPKTTRKTTRKPASKTTPKSRAKTPSKS